MAELLRQEDEKARDKLYNSYVKAIVKFFGYQLHGEDWSPLKSVTQKTKVKLAQHVKELALTPGKKDGEDVYEVSGEWELLPEKSV